MHHVESAVTDTMDWHERAGVLRTLHASVHATWRARDKSVAAWDAWKAAAALSHRSLAHAYIPAFAEALAALQERSEVDVEPLLQFLEADPYFQWSGYTKENLLRWLKRVTFSDGEAERIRALILRSVCRVGWSPRMFQYYARLAPNVDSADFREALKEAECSSDGRIAERAAHVLRLLPSAKKPTNLVAPHGRSL